MPESAVPIIDIAPFLHGDEADKDRVAQAVDDACCTIGFLVVSGHGVSPARVAEIERVTRAFFDRPLGEKLQVRMNADSYRGFMPVGSEDVAYSMDRERSLSDWRECFVTGPFDCPNDAYHRGGARFFAPNKWPEHPAAMQSVWESYYDEMNRLAGDLMRIFARALALDEDFFADKIDHHITNFIASYYPPQPEAPEEGRLRCGPHCDYGSLTIVHSDTGVGGLQVRDQSGHWIDVPHVPGTFVINLGDLMSEWTNDRWRSTVHRVVNPPRAEASTSRLSILFFHQPNYDAVIECLPTCTGPNNPPRYERITSGEHVARKVDMSRAPLLEGAAE